MVRTRPDRKIAHFTAEEMKAAVDKVILEGKSIRIASDESGIKKATLHRYVQKVNKGTIERYEPHYNVHSVFTKEQENNISEYLVKSGSNVLWLNTNAVPDASLSICHGNRH